ncbi:probable adenylate kinase 2, chloroplastic [Drosophila hydei]|uniref:Probable adenylate kinase 2, chloroplastic n=1 Tax=Drosophila hydei TaxID=7224 RepID=A0A6J1M401_DROHY|nr:probable adenylate kinase 2, chloroplastic [Drosophila hydei]
MATGIRMDRSALAEFSAAYMYYMEKHKLLDIMSRILAEATVRQIDDVRIWLGSNIRNIAQEIYSKALNAFHQGIDADYFQLPKNFFHRIVLHGRVGSGRRSLAHVLAQRWNLLILDADTLAYHHINEPARDKDVTMLHQGIENRSAYKISEAIGNIIQKRLLQDDALHRGWILINYPNNRCEARELFETFSVPPNRLVFLQVDEQTARMRLLMRKYAPCPQDNITYMDYQMQQFRKSEPLLNTYLSHRREVIYVNATECFETVKCLIMSQLTKTPYMLGYKYGENSPLD